MKKHLKKLMVHQDTFQGQPVKINSYKELGFIGDIENDLETAVRAFHLYGVMAELASERHKNAEIDCNSYHAHLDLEAREGDRIPGRTNEEAIKQYIRRDDGYVTRCKQVAELKRKAGVLKSLNAAFEKKADALRTRSANERKRLDDLGLSPPTVGRRKKKKKSKGDD